MSMPLKISVMFLLLPLAACMTATPNLHLVEGETRMTLSQSAPISRGADISPDGRYLLTGGIGNFSYWDISRGTLLRRHSTELPQIMGTLLTTAIVPVAFSGQGKQAISGGAEVKLWDLDSGRVLRTLATDPANSLGVSADGSTVLTCEETEWALGQDRLRLHETASGRGMGRG
jgi:WD40 repeat protein